MLTKKVLDRKSEWAQSFRNDLLVRGRFRGNGAIREPHALTGTADSQIADIPCQ
jgi:hypothetical protein